MNLKLHHRRRRSSPPQPAFAQGQMNGPNATKAPKPTVAAVKAVLDKISADPAKVKTYCQLNTVNQQMSQVDEKDQKKMQTLGDQADKLMQQLGPDYAKIMDGLDSVDREFGGRQAVRRPVHGARRQVQISKRK